MTTPIESSEPAIADLQKQASDVVSKARMLWVVYLVSLLVLAVLPFFIIQPKVLDGEGTQDQISLLSLFASVCIAATSMFFWGWYTRKQKVAEGEVATVAPVMTQIEKLMQPLVVRMGLNDAILLLGVLDAFRLQQPRNLLGFAVLAFGMHVLTLLSFQSRVADLLKQAALPKAK